MRFVSHSKMRLLQHVTMILCPVLGCAGTVFGQERSSRDALAEPILTNIMQIWEVPVQERDLPRRMRTEVTIYYHDPEWNVAWGEWNGIPTFLPLAGLKQRLTPGQRVLLDGVILPRAERFIWDRTQINVTGENVELEPKPVVRLDKNPQQLKAKLILAEGLVDARTEVDPTHVSLNFLAGDVGALVYVLCTTNGPRPSCKPGDIVRIKCVYAPEFDRESKLNNLVLWVASPEDVQVIGSLSTDPRFDIPLATSAQIHPYGPTNVPVRVEGEVRRYQPGKWVTIWDATGQITVATRQTYPLRAGDRIEAIGYPYVAGVEKCLRAGLFRPKMLVTGPDLAPPVISNSIPIRLAEQIRYLTHEEADQHLPVELRGVVTWWHPQTGFAYVQDSSGGIRVMSPNWIDPDCWNPGTIVVVRGETCAGDFAPVVTNATVTRDGWWNIEGGQEISLEQALTGADDGRWVEMAGYVRSVTNVGSLARLHLTTSTGEFDAWTPAVESLEWLRGSIVRLRGVCAAIANKRRQLTGVQLWCPGPHWISIDVPAPEDPFAVPKRAIGDLRRFNMESAPHKRVRTTGTVTLHVPGQHLYIQDADESLFALSAQCEQLQPGDQIDIVGFPGNQGRRFLLREAVYRRIGHSSEPKPLNLPQNELLSPELEGLLVRAEGVLVNLVETDSETQLLVQTDETVFKANLDTRAARVDQRLQRLPRGARLAVTGVYEVQSDEYGNPRGFALRLRSPADVVLLKPPPWWTADRLRRLSLTAGAMLVVALGWAATITRKNWHLKQARAALQAANKELEQRVRERTRELEDEVAAKERAYQQLEEAQQSLMLASRQAGMAEVATSVLHNVGNVLNSVNVSIALLNERLRHHRVENVGKAASLLKKPAEELTQFLLGDPKGRALPEYLEKLAEALVNDKHAMLAEVKSLIKSVEHIKVIVSMQQSLAKMGGVLEEVDLTEVVEDAIQLTAAAYERHRIELIRRYAPVSPVLVDRHQVLQILINLLTNAKYALLDKPSDKKVVVEISMAKPDRVRVSVTDNGVGIAPENLDKIFTQGFTTREDGHGFGLHSGANAAKQLGGSLTAYSKGLGHGATFTLELPASSTQTPRKLKARASLVASRVHTASQM